MKQDDEKELVLGNRQLLSIFFVAAVLCGVCFALGYMMGRNATKPLPAIDSSTTGAVDGRRAQPDLPSDNPPVTEAPPAVTETRPVQDPTPAPPVTSIAARTVEAKPLAPEPKPYESKAARTESDSPAVASPESGASYLQVSAAPRPNAEALVKTLREQHLPVIMAVSPKPGFYRVLVGPYHETVQLSDAKTKLKNLGFNGAFVQKQ